MQSRTGVRGQTDSVDRKLRWRMRDAQRDRACDGNETEMDGLHPRGEPATFYSNRVAGARLRSPGPLRTVRESFPSHSSSLSNASKETRLRNGETLAMDRAVALWMKQSPILCAGGTT